MGLTFLFLSALLTAESPPREPALVIYTYDSLVAKGGFGALVFPLFEKSCGCKVKVVATGDAGSLLTRLELASKARLPLPDLLVGIDQNLWDRAKAFVEPWVSWKPSGYEKIRKEARVESGFLPFDYGFYAFMMDNLQMKKKNLRPPKNLQELLGPEWKRQIILEDPRTSTPGLSFLGFTRFVYGSDVWNFWKNLRTQWLNLAPGWDAAYGAFLKEEAPLVWSYTTSQAYHRHQGDKDRYQALILTEGAPIQIEGAALIRQSQANPGRQKLARSFLDFLLSPDVQKEIPRTQWMFPAREDIQLPDEFQNLPKPSRTFKESLSNDGLKLLLKDWAKAIAQKP